MVARTDQTYPEMPGLPAYPDPVETELLRREVDADLLIARKNVIERQKQAEEAAKNRGQKAEEDLKKIQAAEKTVQLQQAAPNN